MARAVPLIWLLVEPVLHKGAIQKHTDQLAKQQHKLKEPY